MRAQFLIILSVAIVFVSSSCMSQEKTPAPEQAGQDQIPEPRAILQCSKSRVRDFYKIRFSPDGKTLATYIRRYDGGGMFSELALRAPERRTTSNRSDFNLWDVQTGEKKFGVRGEFWDFNFSPDNKVLALAIGSSIRIVNVQTGQELTTLDHDGIKLTRFLRDGELLVSEGKSEQEHSTIKSTIKFWDVNNWKQIESGIDKLNIFILKSWGGFISNITPDGKTLAAFCRIENDAFPSEYELKILDIGTGKELPSPKVECTNEMLRIYGSLTFLNDKKLFITGSSISMIWDLTEQEVRPWQDIYSSSFGDPYFGKPWRKKIAQFVDDKWIILDASTNKKIAEFENSTGWKPHPKDPTLCKPVLINDIMLQKLYYQPAVLKIVDSNSGRVVATITDTDTSYPEISPDGELLATSRIVPRVKKGCTLWRTRNGEKLAFFPQTSIRTIRFSPDGKTLATVGSDVRLWDVTKYQKVKSEK